MSEVENFQYAIDKIVYKNLEKMHFFVIQGWCYSKNNSSFVYRAYVNDKQMPIDLVSMQRMDVANAAKKKGYELTDNIIGFHMRVDSLEDESNSFKLYAGKEEIISLNKEDIQKIENRDIIEYSIDSYVCYPEKNLGEISGYAYSNDFDEVEIEVVDNKDNLIDFSKRISQKSNLVDLHMIVDSQKFCGFHISFSYEEGKEYSIRFKCKNEIKKVKLEKVEPVSTPKMGLVKSYIRNANPANLRKAAAYLKNNGVKKFMYRLKFGVNQNRKYTYQDWFFAQRIKESDLEIQKNTKFAYSPKISIIVATFNTKEEYLKEMIDTVINQSYSNWELCIADGSTNDFVEKYVNLNYEIGDKIKFTRLDDNYGISGNMNKALELATGDYVGLYDHDDTLELNCFYEIVSSLQEFQYDIVYTDEDKFDDNKKEYVDPNFKPDYNVDLFRSHNYITHFFCVNKKIIDEVGGMRSEYDGSQDYDFMFRCIEKANGIYHINRILYHWRMHPLSTAMDPKSKMYCYEAGQRAIAAHYERMGIDATVEMMPVPFYGLYHTKYSTKDNPLVSILIPNMNHKDVLKTCIDSLYNVNIYKNFEIIIVENNSTESEIFDYYNQLQKEHSNIQIVTWKGEFNYSAINNYGAKYAKGDYILLLNNDTEMIKPDALEEMVGCCMRPEVGAVGAKLLYSDNTIQHAGVVIGFGGYAGHVFNGEDEETYGYMMRAIVNCDYSACTAACLLIKKSVFNEVDGFDEEFKVACNDVDLCLKIREKNYLIVYNAFALWHHYESKSRGYDDSSKEKIFRFDAEVEKFQAKWSKILKEGDPYYNKNFKIEYGPFRY